MFKLAQISIPDRQIAEGARSPTFAAAPATILLLTALASLGQFASNIYTPPLPSVTLSLGVSDSDAQLTLAISLAGFAVGQVV